MSLNVLELVVFLNIVIVCNSTITKLSNYSRKVDVFTASVTTIFGVELRKTVKERLRDFKTNVPSKSWQLLREQTKAQEEA